MSNQNRLPFSPSGRIQSTRNKILEALPTDQYERLLPKLECVPLNQGTFVYHAREKIEHVYFPISGMISMTSVMEDGRSVEIGNVGKEGMAGLDVVLGVEATPYECVVQIPGAAYRMKSDVVRSEFERCAELQHLLLRYTHAFLIESAQFGVCNRLHTVEQKLATWMMLCRDRIESDYLLLTQDFIAALFGVNRPTISLTAGRLQSDGIIRYTRGKINILDVRGLEELTCECYRTIKNEYAALPV